NFWLERMLDNYLRTLWTLSLAAPIDYIEGHPFDLGKGDNLALYELKPSQPGQAQSIQLKPSQSIRQSLDFVSPERSANNNQFRVFVDDIELLRPIRFKNLPQTTQALKTPMLFVGSAAPDLSKISSEERGGDLRFEAYFLWTPKVVPKEN